MTTSEDFDRNGSRTISHEELLCVAPSTLELDPARPVGWRTVDDQLITSVQEVGLVEFPLVREVDNSLVVLDGTRRVQAAEMADVNPIHVIRVTGDGAAALAAWCSLHVNVFDKTVSDRDCERSLRALVDGPSRAVREWETGEDVEEAAYRLGLRTDADRIADATAAVKGFGEATAERLANEFGDLETVRHASRHDLTAVDGIGDELATRLRDWFDRQKEATARAE